MHETRPDFHNAAMQIDLHEEQLISEDEINYVEDLQELQRVYSRRTPVTHPPELSSCEAIDGWAFDIVERLNEGSLSEDELKMRYRVMRFDDTYEFKPIGDFVLIIDHDTSHDLWSYQVRALTEAAVA